MSNSHSKAKGRRRSRVIGTTEDVYKNVKKYIEEKLEVLDQLRIRLTADEIEHIKSLDNAYDVDRFAHRLILERL